MTEQWNSWTAHLHSLRERIHESMDDCRRAQDDWQRIKDRIAKQHPGPVERRLEERTNLKLKDAYNAVVFHRDMTAMWSVVAAAEIAIQGELRR